MRLPKGVCGVFPLPDSVQPRKSRDSEARPLIWLPHPELRSRQIGSFQAARSVWTGGAWFEPLKQEVKRPGEKAPNELPLACWDGVAFREEVHQSKKQPDR